mgnify:CR=1 FL=1
MDDKQAEALARLSLSVLEDLATQQLDKAGLQGVESHLALAGLHAISWLASLGLEQALGAAYSAHYKAEGVDFV